MGSVVMNLGQCAKEGILLGLKSLFKIELSEPPKIDMRPISQPHIYANNETYAALIVLKHEKIQGSGFIILLISKEMAAKLLKKLGYQAKDITPKLAADFSGEFCNMIAGVFKQEIQKLGLGLISITVPKTYSEGVDEPIADVVATHKYIINIIHEDEQLMTVEVVFSSLGHS